MNDLRTLAERGCRRGAKRARGWRWLIRRAAGVCAVVAVVAAMGAFPAAAQSQKQAKPAAQKPTAKAQVQTGTSTGLDTDTRLLNMLADHQFIRLEAELPGLPPWQEQFYRGVLANRNNDLQKSIELLEPMVDQVVASGSVPREKVLRKTLAEDYLREGNWAKAAEAYQTLETRLGDKLSSDEQYEIEMPVKMMPLAKDHPAMTVDPCGPFVMTVAKNPLGLTDVPVFVDSHAQEWMLDPTLPFNLISRSHAREAGLKISEESVTVETLRGHPIQVHVTLIPRFTIGGQVTMHNVTAFVYDDKDYYFPESKYQVEGALGYSVMSALSSFTVTDSNRLYVQSENLATPTEKNVKPSDSVRFFLDGDQVILALGGGNGSGDVFSRAEASGEARMFAIDAGGQQTYLTSRFYDEHMGDYASLKMELFKLKGLESMAPVPSYEAETIPLTVGTTTVQFHFMPVLTQPIGAAVLDDVYGVLGVDALDQLGSYTFDYKTMRFSIRVSEARD